MNGYAVHLDFQIRINDQPTDPMKFFKKNDDPDYHLVVLLL